MLALDAVGEPAGTLDQLAAAVDLVALLGASLACLASRTAAAGWVLAVTAALWLPANNGVAEGLVLLSFDRTHGMTAADLVAVAGFALSGRTLWRAAPDGRRRGWIAGLCVLAVAGLAAAYAFQN